MPHAISSKPLTRAAFGLALSAAAAVVLSGCGAGQVTQTDQMVAAVPGTSETISDPDEGVKIALRDAYIEFDEAGYVSGGTAPMSIRIFNSGTKAVKLTDVEFPDRQAEAIQVAAGETGAASESPSDAESPSDGESPADGESASDGASASDAPAESELELALPVDGQLLLHPGGEQYLELTGLKEDLEAGDIVTITFIFGDDGKAEMDIPVAPPEEPAERDSPKEHEEGH